MFKSHVVVEAHDLRGYKSVLLQHLLPNFFERYSLNQIPPLNLTLDIHPFLGHDRLRGWKRYERNRHSCACDARSRAGCWIVEYSCSDVHELLFRARGNEDWAINSSCCRHFECLLVSAAGLRKCSFWRWVIMLIRAAPFYQRHNLKVQNFKQRQFISQVSRKMSQITVKLNFCILTFWIHRWSGVILCTVKVQNAARVMSKPHIGKVILLYSA